MSSYGLVVLDREECEELLRTQSVGRIAVWSDQPVILPVVYALLDGDVVFRTAPGAKLMAAVLHQTLAFEADAYDARAMTGWSVNVVGPADELVHPDDLDRARALGLQPWAGEARDRYVRVRAAVVTGRRLAAPDERA